MAPPVVLREEREHGGRWRYILVFLNPNELMGKVFDIGWLIREKLQSNVGSGLVVHESFY